jgi:hypothetical protein
MRYLCVTWPVCSNHSESSNSLKDHAKGELVSCLVQNGRTDVTLISLEAQSLILMSCELDFTEKRRAKPRQRDGSTSDDILSRSKC